MINTHKTLSKKEQRDLTYYLETSAATKNANNPLRTNQPLDKKELIKIKSLPLGICNWFQVIRMRYKRKYSDRVLFRRLVYF